MKYRLIVTLAAVVAGVAALSAQQKPQEPGFSFRTSAQLVNVTVTVTDANGRFVPNLRKEDFLVFEDGKPVNVSHFDNERVPVSLGLVMDTSGSMSGEKIAAAKSAVERFLFGLLDQNDEVFLYQFESRATLVQDWTTDRRSVKSALDRIRASGGTALYDAAAEAVPLAQSGQQRKKAVVIIGQRAHARVDAAGELAGADALPRPPAAAAPAATAAAAASLALVGGRRGRADAAQHHRRQRRAYRDHPQRPGSRLRHRGHRRRIEQAVFPRVHLHGAERRPLAHNRGAAQARQSPRARAQRLRRKLR
jgi:VWFA-related protein